MFFESIPWCRKYGRAIDFELVDEHPACMKKKKGCAHCPEQYQKERRAASILNPDGVTDAQREEFYASRNALTPWRVLH